MSDKLYRNDFKTRYTSILKFIGSINKKRGVQWEGNVGQFQECCFCKVIGQLPNFSKINIWYYGNWDN